VFGVLWLWSQLGSVFDAYGFPSFVSIIISLFKELHFSHEEFGRVSDAFMVFLSYQNALLIYP
jgi:hypothetical protein